MLLARRIADASIGDPAVLLRWLGAAATIAAAEAIRRRGGRPWRGRTGLAFALVVLLLHAGVPAPDILELSQLAVPAAALATLAFAFALAVALFRELRFHPSPIRRGRRDPRPRPASGFSLPVASRPPPIPA